MAEFFADGSAEHGGPIWENMVSSWFPGSTFVVDLANSYAIALTLVIFLFIFVGAEFLACIMVEVKICDARWLEIGKHGKLPGSGSQWGRR